MKDLVHLTLNNLIANKYPFLGTDGTFAAESDNHIAFGGKHHDTYGWVEQHGTAITATGFSPYGRATKDFSNLTDAVLFCIQERFHFKK